MHRRHPSHPAAVRRRAAFALFLVTTAVLGGVHDLVTGPPPHCPPHHSCH
ncbi:hypothetical protein BJY16_008750 [Actinoplanes octamycinicus]|uniref:Uncharacterized protein n=1 Tax=Actinoplanes octamycinicus TaxID=135948 RepID=A0A7W7MCM2_9ACTN|nr:hypothetical protein [Actinoplanes octamycinicus]MBB4745291.1 hypothetical protein [Actinoplanes octamycinicus]